MENLRPNTHRAKYAMIMIVVVMALEIISMLSNYLQYDLLQVATNGDLIYASDAEANDTRQQIVSILYLIAFIISAITFIQWFRRAYYNLGLVRSDLNHTEGWAAGAWFVPIISLFRPYKIMEELYYKTDQCLSENGNYARELSTSLPGCWWLFWIVSLFLSNISTKLMQNAETPEMLGYGSLMSIFSSILMLITGVLALMVINKYSSFEYLLREVKPRWQEIETVQELESEVL